jgi:hypothetical protein
LALLFHQVDLQLESGEYFLKSHEKEARESERKKQKVRFVLLLFWDRKVLDTHLLYFSNQKPQPSDARNARRHILHPLNQLRLPLKKSVTKNERFRLQSWVWKKREVTRNPRKRKKNLRRSSTIQQPSRADGLEYNGPSQYGNCQTTLAAIEIASRPFEAQH